MTLMNFPDIYLASSWKNPHYEAVVEFIRDELFIDAYDFRSGSGGIEADRDGSKMEGLGATLRFTRHMRALELCRICVVVMPCGRSAHLEAGFAYGRGKELFFLWPDGRPSGERHDLMHEMGQTCTSMAELSYRLGLSMGHWVKELGALDVIEQMQK